MDDNIKIYLTDRRWYYVHWTQMVQDKDRWGTFIKTVMKFQVAWDWKRLHISRNIVQYTVSFITKQVCIQQINSYSY